MRDAVERTMRRACVSRHAGALMLGAIAALFAALLLAGCGGPQAGHWDQLTDDPSQPMYALAQDASNPNLVYAAGGGGVVYRLLASTTQVPAPGGSIPNAPVILALAPDPAHAGRVYAGGTGGLYVSTHYGDAWQAASNSGFPASDSIDALIVLPGSGALLAGTTQHGVYASSDGGDSWRASGNGLPPGSDINFFAQDPTGHLMYTSVAGTGLFASSDDGASWHAHSTGLPADVYALRSVTSGGAATLFAATSQGLFSSADGGATWQSHVGSGLPSGKLTALATDARAPSALYAGNDTTVYASSDGGQTWKLLAPGLNHKVTQIVAVSGQLSQPVVFTAAGDGGLLRYPPPPNVGGGIGSTIINVLLFGALAAIAIFALVRSRRQLADMDRRNRDEARAAASRRDRDALGDYMPPLPPPGERRRPPVPPPTLGQPAPPKIRGYGSGGERSGDTSDSPNGAGGRDGADGAGGGGTP